MTPTGIFVLCLLGGVPLLFGLWGLFAQSLRHRHQLQLQRLALLQEALRSPALDEATRRELLAALGRDHSRWRHTAYVAYLAISWSGFVISGGCWAYYRISYGWHPEAAILGCIIAFGLLTLPVAVRELLRRAPAPAVR